VTAARRSAASPDEPTSAQTTEGPTRRRRPEERRRDADRTRGELVQAAFDEFAARGYAGARVQDIAARTGVDKQLISYYFDGKDGLYQEVLHTQFARDAAVSDPNLPLEDNAARYVRHALADPRLTRLLLWAGLSEDPDHPATLPPASLDLTSMIARQQRGEIPDDLDPAVVLLVMIGAVTAAVALPQVIRAIFDLDPKGPDFENHYAEQLRALLAHLRDRQPGQSAPRGRLAMTNPQPDRYHRDSVFTTAELAYMSTQRLARLATVDSHGLPQNSPVGLHYNPATDTIDVIGWNLAASRKYRNVVSNRNVALVVDDMPVEGAPRGIEIRGRADTLPDTDPTTGGRTIIRVHPDRIVSWGLTKLDDPTREPSFPASRVARRHHH